MAVTTMPGAVEKANFRTCPVTGLKVDLAAERLIQVNAVAAVVFILIGGFFALLIALPRWQAIHLLPADWFYRALTAHGFDMLVAWIVFFEVAGLYFGSAVMLNARLVAPIIAWIAYAMMVVGAVLTNVIVLMGKADVIVGKQRHGPTGTVTLQFTPEFTRFSNLAASERLPERME